MLQRKFLGWDRPALQSAADHLLKQYQTAGFADLAEVTVVLPHTASRTSST